MSTNILIGLIVLGIAFSPDIIIWTIILIGKTIEYFQTEKEVVNRVLRINKIRKNKKH
jgi:hypothetical protein